MEKSFERDQLADIVPLPLMPEPLEEVSEDQTSKAPIPGQENKSDQPGQRQRNTNDVNGEVARVLMPLTPIATRALREAPEEASDRKVIPSWAGVLHGDRITLRAGVGKGISVGIIDEKQQLGPNCTRAHPRTFSIFPFLIIVINYCLQNSYRKDQQLVLGKVRA
jgi:hypothetical protein